MAVQLSGDPSRGVFFRWAWGRVHELVERDAEAADFRLLAAEITRAGTPPRRWWQSRGEPDDCVVLMAQIASLWAEVAADHEAAHASLRRIYTQIGELAAASGG